MLIARLPTRPRGSAQAGGGPVDHESGHEIHAPQGPGTELADLYSAIVIAVPLAFLLKWLWP